MKIADGFSGEKAIITPYSIREMQRKNEITRQLFVTHIGYYPNAEHHFIEREEGTPEYILVYCLQGEGWVKFNQDKLKVTQDTCFILPANTYHSYGASRQNPWSIYWLHFQGEQAKHFSSIFSKLLILKDDSLDGLDDRKKLFNDVFRNLAMGYQIENLEYISFSFSHFLASLKYTAQFNPSQQIENLDIIQRSIIFMKENLESKISLEDIANHVGYSVSHFGAIFLNRTKYSPMVYLNQLKIQKACSYLQFTNLKIKEIAYKLGYYDPYHFSKAFSQEMQLTARNYRKKYQKDLIPKR